MTDAPLSQIGKYQLTDILGQGAMGVVYRALDPMLNRYVALKLMSQGIAADAALRDRFLREARAAGSLQHPNIITIFDFGDVDNHLYIAMEFIEGADLSELIERQDPLALPGKLDIIIDVLRALDYAHARGVVHRDIKPANIRVATDGRAKLMDFGIARLESSELTKSGMLIGTPHYMAPEQVSGGVITPSADVFAMGVVLYEFLTYTRAFAGDSLTAVLYQIVAAEPPSFDTVKPPVPASLQAIVQKALAKDPKARYASAGAMALALADVRTAFSGGGQPVTIHARRTPLLGTIVDESILPPEPVSRPGRTRAEPARTSVEPASAPAPAVPAPKSRAPTLAAAAILALGVIGAVAWLALRPRATDPAPAAEVAAAPATPAASAATTPNDSIVPVPASPRAPVPRPSAAPAPQSMTTRETRPAQQADTPRTPLPAPAAPPVTSQPVAPIPQPPSPAPAPVTQPAPSAPDPTPPPVPVDHRPALEQLIASYARAIESRNLDQIRRLYPNLTDAQAQGWQTFFASVRSVRTRLAITDVDVDGSRAVISAAGTHEYSTGGGRAQREPVNIRAVAALDGGVWRLVQVR